MRREAMALSVAACVVFLLAAPQVQAKAVELPFTACETLSLGAEFERHWVDDAGIDHYRNWQWTSTFEGTFGDGTEFSGTGGGLLSWNLDTATGDGDLFGEFSWTIDDFQSGVTFSGRFNGAFAAGVIHDDWIGHAGGAKIVGHGLSSAEECGGVASLQIGVILMPHG